MQRRAPEVGVSATLWALLAAPALCALFAAIAYVLCVLWL